MNLADICIYTRTYFGDKEFLPFLYKSIERHCSGWGDVILVVERDDLQIIQPYVPKWVKIVCEDRFAPGPIQQKFSKITADLHTAKDYIFHIDSDSVFTSCVEISHLSFGGKPYLEYASYEHLIKNQDSEFEVCNLKKYCLDNVLEVELRAYLNQIGTSNVDEWINLEMDNWIKSNFEKWFLDFFENWKRNFGVDLWRLGTQNAIGLPVNHEFSRRPEKLYPRSLYHGARERIEFLHKISFKEFIASRIGRQQLNTSKEMYFSDLNYLGAYLYNFMNSSMEWVDIETKGIHHRPQFVKQFISYDLLSAGVLKPGAADLINDSIN